MKLSLILAGILAASTLTFAQESNAPDQKSITAPPISYEKRVERGFGQQKEPRFAGDRPEWLKQEEADKRVQRSEITVNRGPRGPMMGQGRGQGGPRGPRGMAMNRGSGQEGPEGREMRGNRRGNGPQGKEFRRGPGAQRGFGCMLCEKHAKKVSKKHGGKPSKESRWGGPSVEGPRRGK